MSEAVSQKARYVMIGGFLGAGKSTAVGALAKRLESRGLKLGLITNDQGRGLVDTRSLRHQGFNVEEIAGGCFCCRFDSLKSAADRLTAAERPDVFIAEPVGSCTDLVATVSYPLRRLYGDSFEIAPLSVLVDPVRCARVLGLDEGRRFSTKVRYVYEKQLEEANVLVINKTDLLTPEKLDALRSELERRYPGRPIFAVQARTGEGLDAWFGYLDSESIPHHPTLEIDYQLYGEGEALLGWLNATLRLDAPDEIDGNAWTEDFARRLQGRLQDAGAEVAHLKMTLSPGAAGDDASPDILPGDLALINLVNNDFVPELSERLAAPLRTGQLVVNLRAEASPRQLRDAVDAELGRTEHLELEHVECFEPGQPEPTHRMEYQAAEP
ncbi:MAG: GTP-binding protein [Acidobacteriota bacterium]